MSAWFTPARAAMSRTVAASYPRSAKTAPAARRMRARVSRASRGRPGGSPPGAAPALRCWSRVYSPPSTHCSFAAPRPTRACKDPQSNGRFASLRAPGAAPSVVSVCLHKGDSCDGNRPRTPRLPLQLRPGPGSVRGVRTRP
ncbi:hypothetical protein GPN2_20295 [Streptomyces murinus]